MRELSKRQPPVYIIIFLLGVQLIAFYAHWVLYETLVFTFMPLANVDTWLKWTFFSLGFVFLILQLLVNKWRSRILDVLYAAAAVWIGTVQFFFLACIVFWASAYIFVAFRVLPPWTLMGVTLLGVALVSSVYGVFKSFRPRYVRYYLEIPNLPAEWKGRKAVLVSDAHLGNIRANGSTRKMVRMVNAEKPDIVFMPGDLFDGPPADYKWLAAPLADIRASLGTYFTEGNHEEFSDPAPYLAAIRDAGVNILNKEMVTIDGLQILGVPYYDSNEPDEVQASLAAIPFNPEKPSILLKHAPSVVRSVAAAGVSLVLCGHTHNGQIWPYNYLVRRLFGKAGYGHSWNNNLQIVTTSGFGTWGPPQRLGTHAEVVVIKFK